MAVLGVDKEPTVIYFSFPTSHAEKNLNNSRQRPLAAAQKIERRSPLRTLNKEPRQPMHNDFNDTLPSYSNQRRGHLTHSYNPVIGKLLEIHHDVNISI